MSSIKNMQLLSNIYIYINACGLLTYLCNHNHLHPRWLFHPGGYNHRYPACHAPQVIEIGLGRTTEEVWDCPHGISERSGFCACLQHLGIGVLFWDTRRTMYVEGLQAMNQWCFYFLLNVIISFEEEYQNVLLIRRSEDQQEAHGMGNVFKSYKNDETDLKDFETLQNDGAWWLHDLKVPQTLSNGSKVTLSTADTPSLAMHRSRCGCESPAMLPMAQTALQRWNCACGNWSNPIKTFAKYDSLFMCQLPGLSRPQPGFLAGFAEELALHLDPPSPGSDDHCRTQCSEPPTLAKAIHQWTCGWHAMWICYW